jgi:hypothetical protein
VKVIAALISLCFAVAGDDHYGADLIVFMVGAFN